VGEYDSPGGIAMPDDKEPSKPPRETRVQELAQLARLKREVSTQQPGLANQSLLLWLHKRLWAVPGWPAIAETLREIDETPIPTGSVHNPSDLPPSPDRLIPMADLDHAIANAVEQSGDSPERKVVADSPSTISDRTWTGIRFLLAALMEGAMLSIVWDAPLWIKIATVVLGAILYAVVEYRTSIRAIHPALLWGLFSIPTLLLFGVVGVAYHGVPLPSSTASFVDPLHEDIVKWQIAERVRSATIAGLLSQNCHVTIVSLQEPHAQDYATDFRRILDVINWKYDARFASGPVDRGISVLAIVNEIQSRACAIYLAAPIMNSAHTKDGNSLGNILRWVSSSDAPDYLKSCLSTQNGQGGCLEVDFGHDDDR
jgi:hypothetical protein